ncbi:hypothetical protein D3C72_2549370 [compost metagenome]
MPPRGQAAALQSKHQGIGDRGLGLGVAMLANAAKHLQEGGVQRIAEREAQALHPAHAVFT